MHALTQTLSSLGHLWALRVAPVETVRAAAAECASVWTGIRFPWQPEGFGAEGGYWGWTWRPSCLHCVRGTCCKCIPLCNSITCQTRKRKLLLQRTTSFKSVSCNFQLSQRKTQLAHKSQRLSPLLSLLLERIHVRQNVWKHQEHADILDALNLVQHKLHTDDSVTLKEGLDSVTVTVS